MIAKRMQAYVDDKAPEAACYPDVLDLDAADYEAAQVRLDDLTLELSLRRARNMVLAEDGTLREK